MSRNKPDVTGESCVTTDTVRRAQETLAKRSRADQLDKSTRRRPFVAAMVKVFVSLVLSGLVTLGCGMSALAEGTQQPEGQPADPKLYFEVDSLHEGLPPIDTVPDLTTPRATLLHFLRAAGDGRFDQAAYSMKFENRAKEDRSPALLAMELYYVTTQQIDPNLRKVPDRPNGAADDSTEDSDSQNRPGRPRRSIKIGEIPLALEDVEIRLERFKPQDGEPVWLFSPRIVAKIPDMYAQHGPGPAFDYLPLIVREGLTTGSSRWQWSLLLAIMTLTAAFGWLFVKLLRHPLRRMFPESAREKSERLRAPLGSLIGLASFYLVIYVWLSPP